MVHAEGEWPRFMKVSSAWRCKESGEVERGCVEGVRGKRKGGRTLCGGGKWMEGWKW